MIKTLTDIIFNACKNQVGFYRSEYFKEWFHKEYPGMDMHHLFCSIGPLKTSDFYSIPLTRQSHNLAHKDNSQFAIDNLPELFKVITKYILYLEKRVVDLEQQQ